MGYKLSFMDNQVYSAQDINLHFSRMFTGGVSLAEGENVLSGLNSLTSDAVSVGVIPDGVKVVKTANGYKINTGTAYMEDGSAITFDADGYEFTSKDDCYRYVYLKRNEPANTIDIVVSETAPEGDFVPLAEITNAGEVLDRRKYAQLKIHSPQAGTLKNFEVTFNYSTGIEGRDFDIGSGNFSYVIMWDGMYSMGNTNYAMYAAEKCILPITDGEEILFNLDDSGGHPRGTIYFKKNGQVLETRASVGSSSEYVFRFGVI